MTPDLFQLLIDLHSGAFSPDLFNPSIVGFNAERRLSKVEYHIVDLKIGGATDEEVCEALKLKKSSLKQRMKDIKSKYRNYGLDLRVDDWNNLRTYIKQQKGNDTSSTIKATQ